MATLAYLDGNNSNSISAAIVEPELFIDNSGNVFMRSPLAGGYTPLTTIREWGYENVNELRGNPNFEELNGTLDGGFKFKAKPMKVKVPRVKLKTKINTKGVSRAISGVGKSVSSAVKGAGKLVSNVARGAGEFAQSLLSDDASGDQDQEQEQQPEDDQDTSTEGSNEEAINDTESDYTVGCQISDDGRKYRYSPIDKRFIELSGHELGALTDILSTISSSGGSKGGLLSLATTGLDAIVPGAGSVASMGINAVQKQNKQKQAKKKANQQKRDQAYNNFVKSKLQNNTTSVKYSPQQRPIQKQQSVSQSAAPVITRLRSQPSDANFQSDVNRAINQYPTVRNETPSNQNQTDSSASKSSSGIIMLVVGAAIVLVLFNGNKEKTNA